MLEDTAFKMRDTDRQSHSGQAEVLLCLQEWLPCRAYHNGGHKGLEGPFTRIISEKKVVP